MPNPAGKYIQVITIDGPSGSGKSTAARLLAQRLGFAYLDTGAMYRAVTYEALRRGLNLRDGTSLIELAKSIDLDLQSRPEEIRVLINGQDVSEELRTIAVTDNAHFVASRRGIRDEMVKRQRKLAQKLGRLVSEGRDQGTVVFPDAQVKFFLDADPAERAQRRYLQLSSAGENATYRQVLEAMQTRDGKDRNRCTAPLEIPQGAIVVDTTKLTVQQMIDQLAEHVRRVLKTDQSGSADHA